MKKIALVALLLALSMASLPEDFVCPFRHEDFIKAAKPCTLGGEACDHTDAHDQRVDFFEATCRAAHAAQVGTPNSVIEFSPIADWSFEAAAELRSGVEYGPGSGSSSGPEEPIMPTPSFFEVTDPYLNLEFDPNRLPDEKAVECVSPKEGQGKVCNYSWAYALKALMDSAYNKETNEDRSFSFDFIRYCLFPGYDHCLMHKPIDMLAEIVTANKLVPFEEDFDYLGADTCDSYSRAIGYGGEFAIHTPERNNPRALMNFITEYPTMVLTGIDMPTLQFRGRGVRFSMDSGVIPNIRAGDKPNLYGVAAGFVDYGVTVTKNEVDQHGMWFVDTRPMTCYQTMLNIPMRNHDTRGNYAGIGGYAVGLSFHKQRNEKVGASHDYFTFYNRDTATLTIPESHCRESTVSYALLSDFDYLNVAIFASNCSFQDATGAPMLVPPSDLRALTMRGGCYLDAPTSKLICEGQDFVSAIELVESAPGTSAYTPATSIVFRSLERLRRVSIGNQLMVSPGRIFPNLVNVVFEGDETKSQITTLTFVGTYILQGMTSYNFAALPNLRYLSILGRNALKDLSTLSLTGLKRLERVTIKGLGACTSVEAIEMNDSFRKGYDTSLSILNGAMNEQSALAFVENGSTYLFRILIAGSGGNLPGSHSLSSLKDFQWGTKGTISPLRGLYHGLLDDSASPDSVFDRRFTVYFIGCVGSTKLKSVTIIGCSAFYALLHNSLCTVTTIQLLDNKYIVEYIYQGQSTLQSATLIDFGGSFDASNDSSKLIISDGALSGGSAEYLTLRNGFMKEIHIIDSCNSVSKVLQLSNFPLVHTLRVDNSLQQAKALHLLNMPSLVDFAVTGPSSMQEVEKLDICGSFDAADLDLLRDAVQIPSTPSEGALQNLDEVVYCVSNPMNASAADVIIEKVEEHFVGKKINRTQGSSNC